MERHFHQHSTLKEWYFKKYENIAEIVRIWQKLKKLRETEEIEESEQIWQIWRMLRNLGMVRENTRNSKNHWNILLFWKWWDFMSEITFCENKDVLWSTDVFWVFNDERDTFLSDIAILIFREIYPLIIFI